MKVIRLTEGDIHQMVKRVLIKEQEFNPTSEDQMDLVYKYIKSALDYKKSRDYTEGEILVEFENGKVLWIDKRSGSADLIGVNNEEGSGTLVLFHHPNNSGFSGIEEYGQITKITGLPTFMGLKEYYPKSFIERRYNIPRIIESWNIEPVVVYDREKNIAFSDSQLNPRSQQERQRAGEEQDQRDRERDEKIKQMKDDPKRVPSPEELGFEPYDIDIDITDND